MAHTSDCRRQRCRNLHSLRRIGQYLVCVRVDLQHSHTTGNGVDLRKHRQGWVAYLLNETSRCFTSRILLTYGVGSITHTNRSFKAKMRKINWGVFRIVLKKLNAPLHFPRKCRIISRLCIGLTSFNFNKNRNRLIITLQSSG